MYISEFVVCGLDPLASPDSLLKRETLKSLPRPTESESLAFEQDL